MSDRPHGTRPDMRALANGGMIFEELSRHWGSAEVRGALIGALCVSCDREDQLEQAIADLRRLWTITGQILDGGNPS